MYINSTGITYPPWAEIFYVGACSEGKSPSSPKGRKEGRNEGRNEGRTDCSDSDLGRLNKLMQLSSLDEGRDEGKTECRTQGSDSDLRLKQPT